MRAAWVSAHRRNISAKISDNQRRVLCVSSLAAMMMDLWVEVLGLAIAAFLTGLIAAWLVWKLGKTLA